MRSYFCEKCNFEFDLEVTDEADEAAFCPKCLTTLSRLLPETPERIIARAHRLERARQKQVQRSVLLVSLTVIIAGCSIAGMICFPASFWGMLLISLSAGTLSGIWTREFTQNRSWRAGFFALIIMLIFLGVCIFLAYFSNRFFFAPACRNLAVGVIPAWCIAIFER